MRISDWSSDVCSSDLPLVIPPDFALTPPKPGAPRLLEVDSQGQALRALFGDTMRAAPKSDSEQKLLDQSGATQDATIGARSKVGDRGPNVVNKGRSDERREGKWGVSTCRTTWAPYEAKEKEQKR